MADMLRIDEVADALKAKLATAKLAPRGTYTSEYTGPCRKDCPICAGAGLVRLEVERDDPRFGKLEPCPNVPMKNRNTRWRHGLTINEQDRLTWESFSPTPVTISYAGNKEHTTTDKFALRIRDYLARQGWGWVWLCSYDRDGQAGIYGVAKSMIIKAVVADAVRSNRAGAYVRASELIDDLKLAFDEKHPNENAVERVNAWVNVPVLAVDEFEKVKPTEWVMDRLLQIMDRRYELAKDHQSITLVASNLPPEDIDGSLGSRARDGRFLYIEMHGRDARPGMTAEDIF